MTRKTLVESLYDKIKAENNKVSSYFGTAVEQIDSTENNVSVSLSTGQRVTADLLIGTDGVRSKTREQIFTEAANCGEALGYKVLGFELNSCDPIDGVGEQDFYSYSSLNNTAEFHHLDQSRLVGLYIWKGPSGSFFDRKEALINLRNNFVSSHPKTLEYVSQVKDDTMLFFDEMTIIDLPRWSKKRTVLLGDAAFCPTLPSGQGAGMALHSANILAEQLAISHIYGVLENYETMKL